MKTATLQHRIANTRIVIVALVMALGGCASTGSNAPNTTRESASGAVVGTLGAAGGAVGGAALGAIQGLQCGIGAIICSPVMAIVIGVKGAVAGGEAGAKAGVNWSRSDSATAAEPASVPH